MWKFLPRRKFWIFNTRARRRRRGGEGVRRGTDGCGHSEEFHFSYFLPRIRRRQRGAAYRIENGGPRGERGLSSPGYFLFVMRPGSRHPSALPRDTSSESSGMARCFRWIDSRVLSLCKLSFHRGPARSSLDATPLDRLRAPLTRRYPDFGLPDESAELRLHPLRL